MGIFKAYDIRGIYPEEINEEVAYELGKAIGTFFGKNKTLIVGRDCRISSPSLKKELIKGLVECGINVIDCGLTTTPTYYHLIAHFNVDGGVMVTASHNPKEYNGFKINGKNGKGIGKGFGLEKIEEIFYKKKFVEPSKKGNVRKAENCNQIYLDFLEKLIPKIDKPIKIVADLSNGCASLIFLELIKKIENLEVVVLNENINGNFPAHDPEPNKENLKELSEEIKNINADFGVAFDGDADRIVFLDENGSLIPGDFVLTWFVDRLFKQKRIKKIVCEITCTAKLKEIVEKYDGKLVESRVGRVFILNEMLKNDADIGGEISSHFYFKQANYFDDSFFAFLLFLSLYSKENKKLSSIIKEFGFPKKEYFKIRLKNDKEKIEKMEFLKKYYLKKYENTSLKDGIKVLLDSSWFVIRPSNTEPLLRIVIESENYEKIENIKDEIMRLLKE